MSPSIRLATNLVISGDLSIHSRPSVFFFVFFSLNKLTRQSFISLLIQSADAHTHTHLQTHSCLLPCRNAGYLGSQWSERLTVIVATLPLITV